MLRISLLIIAVALSGCAPRAVDLAYDPDAGRVGKVQEIYVGTNRNSVNGGRSEEVNFGRIDISVPPNRRPGEIKFPSGKDTPDPSKHFLVTQELRYADQRVFRQAVNKAIARQPAGRKDVVLFVHGYNNTFAEGLYRYAQFAHDISIPAVEMHFAWPSRGQALAYAADRDSVMFSRSGIEAAIDTAVDSNAQNVVLIAHSMGSQLLMEGLRDMALRGDRRGLARINGVILMSPDIDLDVFRQQAHDIGRDLPQPFLIFTSSKDRALRLSALISGEPLRLGTVTDAHLVSDLPVTLVDVGAFSTGDGHFNAATSPALISILGNIGALGTAFAGDAGGSVGLLTGAALQVERAAQVVIRPTDAFLGQ